MAKNKRLGLIIKFTNARTYQYLTSKMCKPFSISKLSKKRLNWRRKNPIYPPDTILNYNHCPKVQELISLTQTSGLFLTSPHEVIQTQYSQIKNYSFSALTIDPIIIIIMKHHRLHFHNFLKPAPNKCESAVAWWKIIIESIGIASVALFRTQNHILLHPKRRMSIA